MGSFERSIISERNGTTSPIISPASFFRNCSLLAFMNSSVSPNIASWSCTCVSCRKKNVPFALKSHRRSAQTAARLMITGRFFLRDAWGRNATLKFSRWCRQLSSSVVDSTDPNRKEGNWVVFLCASSQAAHNLAGLKQESVGRGRA